MAGITGRPGQVSATVPSSGVSSFGRSGAGAGRAASGAVSESRPVVRHVTHGDAGVGQHPQELATHLLGRVSGQDAAVHYRLRHAGAGHCSRDRRSRRVATQVVRSHRRSSSGSCDSRASASASGGRAAMARISAARRCGDSIFRQASIVRAGDGVQLEGKLISGEDGSRPRGEGGRWRCRAPGSEL